MSRFSFDEGMETKKISYQVFEAWSGNGVDSMGRMEAMHLPSKMTLVVDKLVMLLYVDWSVIIFMLFECIGINYIISYLYIIISII